MSRIDNNNNNFKTVFFTTAGAIAGWEAEPYIKRVLSYPIKRYKDKIDPSIYGGGFEHYASIAIDKNNLNGKLKLLNLNETTKNAVAQELHINLNKPVSKFEKILNHILRRNSHIKDSFMRTLEGKNAFFVPQKNTIVCNFDKFGSAAFHEIAHKLNSQSSNVLLRFLSEIRGPMALLAPVISLVAMTTSPKSDDHLYKGWDDYIKDNCGWLATVSVLPLTIEECIANVRGTKIAKQAGVTGKNLEKVIKAHKLSALGYCSSAILTGLSVYLASKLRDVISAQGKKNKD